MKDAAFGCFLYNKTLEEKAKRVQNLIRSLPRSVRGMSDWWKQQREMETSGGLPGLFFKLMGKGRKTSFKERSGLSLASAMELRKIQTALRDGWSVVQPVSVSVPIVKPSHEGHLVHSEHKMVTSPPVTTVHAKWGDATQTVKTVSTQVVSKTSTINRSQEKVPQPQASLPKRPQATLQNQLQNHRVKTKEQKAWYDRQTATSSKIRQEEHDGLDVLFAQSQPPGVVFDESLRKKVRWPSESMETSGMQPQKKRQREVINELETNVVDIQQRDSLFQSNEGEKSPEAAPQAQSSIKSAILPHGQVSISQPLIQSARLQVEQIVEPPFISQFVPQPSGSMDQSIAEQQRPIQRHGVSSIFPKTPPSVQQSVLQMPQRPAQRQEVSWYLPANAERPVSSPRFATEDLANELMKRLFAKPPSFSQHLLPDGQDMDVHTEHTIHVQETISYRMPTEPEVKSEAVFNPTTRLKTIESLPVAEPTLCSSAPLLDERAQNTTVDLAERELDATPVPMTVATTVLRSSDASWNPVAVSMPLPTQKAIAVEMTPSSFSFESSLPNKVNPSQHNPYKAKRPAMRSSARTFHYNPVKFSDEPPPDVVSSRSPSFFGSIFTP
jgi:hypothetical protein